MASSDHDLLYALGQLVAMCDLAKIRVCISKSKAMILCQKAMDCFLQGIEFLLQAKKSMHLGMLFTSNGTIDQEMDKDSHELLEVTERMASQIEVVHISGLSLRDPEVGLLFLAVGRDYLRWLGHLLRMTLGRLPWEVYQGRPAGRRPRVARIYWSDYISPFAMAHLQIPWEELKNVACDEEF